MRVNFPGGQPQRSNLARRLRKMVYLLIARSLKDIAISLGEPFPDDSIGSHRRRRSVCSADRRRRRGRAPRLRGPISRCGICRRPLGRRARGTAQPCSPPWAAASAVAIQAGMSADLSFSNGAGPTAVTMVVTVSGVTLFLPRYQRAERAAPVAWSANYSRRRFQVLLRRECFLDITAGIVA